MPVSEGKFQTIHPDPNKSGPRISKVKYEAVKKAILTAVPKEGNGLPFKDLPHSVRELLSAEDLALLGSVSWYTTVVKLDLEARGDLERVSGARPQRLLRT